MESVPQSHYARLYHDARKNSGVRGIPFDLSRAEFDRLVERADGRCMMSGIAFNLEVIPGAARRPWAPSLDRIDSGKGYTASNVRLVCCAVNLAMNEWGAGVLLKMARNLVLHEEQIARQMMKPGRRYEGVPFYTVREYAAEVGVELDTLMLRQASRLLGRWCEDDGIQRLRVWVETGQVLKSGVPQVKSDIAYPLGLLDQALAWRPR